MGKTRKSQGSPKPLLPRLVIHLQNQQKALPIRKRLVRLVVRELFSFLQIEANEISLYFVTPKKIQALHAQFFQDPTPTDCISFPLDQEHLGEIFICPEVALTYAKEHDVDPWQEILLYLIHGLLHLLGFDDTTPLLKKKMRNMEKKCMSHIHEHLLPY